MSNETAVQVSKEEEMAGMVATMVTFLQDATKLPTLRKELEALRAECESLKREKDRLQSELALSEAVDKETTQSLRDANSTIGKLNGKLSSLQHKFDTIQGIVAAAMAEARADEPKVEPKVDPTPWTPSTPLRSAY